jgi:hypothetical protein
VEEVVLVDEGSEGEEGVVGEGAVVGEDLHGGGGTWPWTVREAELRLESRESSVVLPAPEGPIIASISPGRQKPEQSCRMGLSATCADRFCQVIETDFMINIWNSWVKGYV